MALTLFYLCACLQNYFSYRPEHEAQCTAVLVEMASKMVRDMHYEARVNSVRNWYAERKIKLDKKRARDILMQPWQYLQVAAFLYYRFC